MRRVPREDNSSNIRCAQRRAFGDLNASVVIRFEMNAQFDQSRCRTTEVLFEAGQGRCSICDPGQLVRMFGSLFDERYDRFIGGVVVVAALCLWRILDVKEEGSGAVALEYDVVDVLPVCVGEERPERRVIFDCIAPETADGSQRANEFDGPFVLVEG